MLVLLGPKTVESLQKANLHLDFLTTLLQQACRNEQQNSACLLALLCLSVSYAAADTSTPLHCHLLPQPSTAAVHNRGSHCLLINV
jgi:uncharacterized protein (UPF0305 family)